MLTREHSIFWSIIPVIIAVFILTPIFVPHAAASDPSIGCEILNIAFIFDWQYSGISVSPIPMNANELLNVISDYPVNGGPTPTGIELQVNGSTVDVTSFPGTLTYTIPADGDYDFYWFNTPNTVDTTWDVECTVIIPVAYVPGPGPDMVLLPPGSVVGAFVNNAMLLYEPDDTTPTGDVMTVGKTLWVTGLSADKQFYQVVLSGLFLWVPVESMGPNYDEVWNGTPLPTTVVEEEQEQDTE